MIVIGRVKEIMKDDKYPSIIELISEKEINRKKDIVDYLKRGTITSASPSGIYDVINGEKIDTELQMMNDGKYAWRSDLIYYVEKYNMKLPDDFINHIFR